MVLFPRKNEWKRGKRYMQLRNIGVCKVMKDKEMESGFSHG